MSLLYYILYIKFLVIYSYEFLNISPYEKISVQFTLQKPYNIFKYSLMTVAKNDSAYLAISSIENTNKEEYDIYLYLDKEKITEKNGIFTNYYAHKQAINYALFDNCINHDYYVVIKNNEANEIKDTFSFFSTDYPYVVNKFFSQEYLSINNRRQSYIFTIFSNLSKYIKIGLTNNGYGINSIIYKTKDNNNPTIYELDTDIYFSNTFKLNENGEYSFNFSLFYSSTSSCFLYLIKTNYTTITEVEKNKDKFENIPALGDLYIALDISTTPVGNKLVFEYDYEWFSKTFNADGYTINDLEIIDNAYIKQNLFLKNITLKVEKKKCKKGNICEGYIQRDNSDLKTVILKISKGSNEQKYIKFRYGKEIYSLPKNALITCLIGFVLSLPNIFFQIVRKCRSKMTASAFTLMMNILLNFAYANLFGFLLELGNNDSLIIGIVLISIYGFLCLISLFLLCSGVRAYFDVIANLCNKLDKAKSLNEVISMNRKLYPTTKVGCVAEHEESREVWEEYEEYDKPVYRTVVSRDSDGNETNEEVFDHYEKDYRYYTTHYSEWDRVDNGGGKMNGIPGSVNSRYEKKVEYRTVETWRKELEYHYKSWQDDTKSIENVKYCSIVKATFSYRITFDSNSQSTMTKMKDDLYKEGKTYDTDVRTYDVFKVPGFTEKHTCPLNESEYNRIQKLFGNSCGYLVWTIFFVLGYSSIIEAYSRYEVGK